MQYPSNCVLALQSLFLFCRVSIEFSIKNLFCISFRGDWLYNSEFDLLWFTVMISVAKRSFLICLSLSLTNNPQTFLLSIFFICLPFFLPPFLLFSLPPSLPPFLLSFLFPLSLFPHIATSYKEPL